MCSIPTDVDPFEKRARLPARPERRRDLFNAVPVPDEPEPHAENHRLKGESADWISRPALCIERAMANCSSSCRRSSISPTTST